MWSIDPKELDHSRAQANDLQKVQAEQLTESMRISKALESMEPVGDVGVPFVMVR